MKNGTPRYVFPSKGSSTFEFPIVYEFGRTPVASVAVAADKFDDALLSAFEWAVTYTRKTEDEKRFFPEVTYRAERRLVKKLIDGYAYTEEVGKNPHTGWIPVLALSHAAAIENITAARAAIAADNAASGERIRAMVAGRTNAAHTEQAAQSLSPQQRAWVTIRANRAAKLAAQQAGGK